MCEPEPEESRLRVCYSIYCLQRRSSVIPRNALQNACTISSSLSCGRMRGLKNYNVRVLAFLIEGHSDWSRREGSEAGSQTPDLGMVGHRCREERRCACFSCISSFGSTLALKTSKLLSIASYLHLKRTDQILIIVFLTARNEKC
jgi:hypothetical protein